MSACFEPVAFGVLNLFGENCGKSLRVFVGVDLENVTDKR